jgi:FtsP/CotA-like multicopper oxidase with cupredoxin domain
MPCSATAPERAGACDFLLTSVVVFGVASRAGAWMMHCHILEHAEAGMMIDVVDA